jgi:hypothetical protein
MKSKLYRRKVDTLDEQLDHILDVIAGIKERQDALSDEQHIMSLHKLQSARMLTVQFSKTYYTS